MHLYEFFAIFVTVTRKRLADSYPRLSQNVILRIHIQVWAVSLFATAKEDLVYSGAMLGPYPLIYARGHSGLVVAER